MVEVCPFGSTYRAYGKAVDLIEGEPNASVALMATDINDAVAEARKLVGRRLGDLHRDFLEGA